MKDWKKDKADSDRFLPEIKRILGHYLIDEPPQEEDMERNTDLIVLRLAAVRIGCRVRSHEYLHERGGVYRDEFTIREARLSGTKTELAKIIEGWGDYFFYGFADAIGDTLAAWVLGDLRVFRLWFQRELVRLPQGELPGASYPNKDNSSCFRVFSLMDMPKAFVVGRRHYDVQDDLPF